MGGEDVIEPPAFSKTEYMSENDGPHGSSSKVDSLPLDSDAKNEINGEASESMLDDACQFGSEVLEGECYAGSTMVVDDATAKACGSIPDSSSEIMKAHMTTDRGKDAVNNTRTEPVDSEMTEQVAVVNAVVTDNGAVAVDNENILSNHKQNGTSISGVKRPRIAVDEHQPSVRVIYNSLTKESKRKLEDLLQQWSRWHGQNCSLSNDPNTVIESGEETYFPALCVGLNKPSQVTFWVDNQTKSNKEFIPLDGTSVPLYDRGYSLALTSGDAASGLKGEGEKLDDSRCFNCSSYGHGLKDCPMPRDNVAVNSARKQHRSQRNQSANSRNSVRYYQSSRGGKYEGLTPGVLDPETRQLLGLGELDPPPWLNRMREIGYPPGYLDPDVEDQPSGITIFGDEPNKDEGEEGEIVGARSSSEPTRKKSVEFPGINAPIPAHANERLWAASSSDTNLPREGGSHHRGHNYLSENLNRVNHHEQRWSTDLDDERPPGTDSWSSPSLANHFRRHGDYDRETSFSSGVRFDRYNDYDRDYSYMSNSPRGNSSSWSPSYSRSLSDRGRRSPLAQDDYRPYGTYPHSYPR